MSDDTQKPSTNPPPAMDSQNPMEKPKPPVMPTVFHKDGGDHRMGNG